MLAKTPILCKAIVFIGVLSLLGCSLPGTRVDTDHHLVSRAGEASFAVVYFLRPEPERTMGFSDNVLAVSLDDRPLLTIDKGDYALVYMRPRVRATLTLENLTEVGPTHGFQARVENETALWPRRGDWPTKTMSKHFEYGFTAGEVYYIVLEPVNGEHRGVFFKPHLVDEFDAKQLAAQLRPVGEAKKAPLVPRSGFLGLF